MSIVPIIHIGSAFGFMALLALLTMNYWFFSQSLQPPSKNLWEDAFKLIHDNADRTELEFQTSGDFNLLRGLKWNMSIKAKLPCTHGEEMIEEMSQADEEKSFKLLDQLHSAILLKERERIIGSEHALGHLLRFENSGIFSSEEIDFKKVRRDTWQSVHFHSSSKVIENGTVVWRIPWGKTLILKFKASQGRLKYQYLDNAESFEIFRRADTNNTTALYQEILGIVEAEYDDPKLYWLLDSDEAQIIAPEIDFLKSQLKTGVFLSLKVIGPESSEKRIGYNLQNLSGSRENCAYKFSSNLHIDSQSIPDVGQVGNSGNGKTIDALDPTKDNAKPMIIRIPRGQVEIGKLNYLWYNFISLFRFLFSSPIDHFCLTYERGIKADIDMLLPKAIVSFLICY